MREAMTTLVLGTGLLLGHQVGAAEELFQNDGWASGQAVAYQDGLVAGDALGVTLGPIPQVATLKAISLLWGGDTTSTIVTLVVYLEAGTDEPGAVLHQADYLLTGSSSDTLAWIDLTSAGIALDAGARVRVVLVLAHAGLPCVARDVDGIQPGVNWLHPSGASWVDSASAGVQGDWVIRALVESAPAAEDAGGEDSTVDDASGTTPDAGVVDAAAGADHVVLDSHGVEDAASQDAAQPADAAPTPDAAEPPDAAAADLASASDASQSPDGGVAPLDATAPDLPARGDGAVAIDSAAPDDVTAQPDGASPSPDVASTDLGDPDVASVDDRGASADAPGLQDGAGGVDVVQVLDGSTAPRLAPDAGCGCGAAPRGASFALALGVLLLLRARRPRA